jgi:hypothetical protein
MSTTPLIERIQKDISDAKGSGAKEVALDRLEKYIEELKEHEKIQNEIMRLSSLRAQRKLEIWKTKRQRAWDEWLDKSQWRRESWKIRSKYKFDAHKLRVGLLSQGGLATVKALLWLNGGGAAAILAFLATLANAKGSPPFVIDIQLIRCGLVLLFVGAGLAASCSGIDYIIGALRFASERPRWKTLLTKISVFAPMVVGAGSLASFIAGGYQVYLGLKPAL